MSLTPEEIKALRTSVGESYEQIQRALEQLGSTPDVVNAAGIADQSANGGQITRGGVLTLSERMAVREAIRFNKAGQLRPKRELFELFAKQAQVKAGIPLETWLNAGGQAVQQRFDGSNGLRAQVDPDVVRALDTTGASALIRQDLEPVLYEIYVRTFPAFDRFTKEPANGLVHAYNQITSYGDAAFMAELGTVTDDKSTYVRKTSNVAILATRRGISLKSQFAVLAGGAGYNPDMLELQGGLRAMSHKMQYQIFSGISSDSTGTANNELGAYDVNAFDGLRSILNTSRAGRADPIQTTPDDIRRAINKACVQIMQQGGDASMIWGNPTDKETFDAQQDKNVRYMAPENLMEVAVGVVTNAVNTVLGPLPFGVVPGDSISPYVPDNTANSYATVEDIYVLDESTISLPYLGTDGPTVLEIPIGISGQLTKLYIIFGMWGLAVKAPQFSNKVRIRQT